MIQKIRNSFWTKGVAMLLVLNFLAEIIQPTAALALTGGPSQPEMQGFTPIGTSENVDLSTGAFNYNIPLLDVGGYPINMSYSSGVTMDQEASWVGLGWSLNPGVMNRNMRGIPDDFSGEKVEKEFNMRPNVSAGVNGSLGAELFGFDGEKMGADISLSFGMGVNWNNYDGFGFSMTLSPTFDFSSATSTSSTAELGLGVGLTASDDGLNINPNISFSSKEDHYSKANTDLTMGIGVGFPFNSRSGFKTMSVQAFSSETLEGGRLQKFLNEKEHVAVDAGVSGRGGGIGSTISMVSNTYIPTVEFPKVNSGVSFSGKMGPTFFGLDGTVNVSGYYSQQTLLLTELNIPAFGYLYSQEGQNLEYVLHDFNREKDAAYTKGSPNLPVTNYTYDIYSASGQGVGGMFRPFRNDIGHVYDNIMASGGIDGSLGLEFGAGNLAKGGLDIDVNFSGQFSKKWEGPTNKAKSIFTFQKSTRGDLYEPVYFKQVGEMAVDEDPLFENMQSYHPVAIRLLYPSTGINVESSKELYSDVDFSIPVNFPTKRSTGRSKRNTLFSYLTRQEDDLALNTGSAETPYPSQDHHLSEITVTRNDGVRYVYGIPAYNTTQREATFNVGEATNDGSGIVTYATGDNSVSNTKGIDHYFERTTTPAFAHGYLLTAVISPDYVDRSGDGPSLDDYGTYTKFTYDRVYTDYKWRVPYNSNSANFNEGLLTITNDNKGSYVYGTKEIWYLEKIETKTHTAIFHTSGRHDAMETTGENGGLGNRSMEKLDSISLYTKPDYDANGSGAFVVKRVHFEYDYYLCPGVDNNDGAAELNSESVDLNLNEGKLTLREIYFTYGNSHKGRLSGYKFKYGDLDGDGNEDTGGNASYDLKDYNMWGSYKPNSSTLTNAEFPYVEQNKTQEDAYVTQWHLTNIVMPSGGEMKINYESNDYGYVQDKEALQFFSVVGAAYDINAVTSLTGLNTLWGPDDNPGEEDNLYTIVSLPTEMSSYTSQEFIDNVLKPLGDNPVRFNYFMNLSVDGLNSDLSEYVSGYGQIDRSGNYATAGIKTIGTTNYGYFKFIAVPEENKNTTPDSHPVAKTAWQWVRMYNPHLAYDQNGGVFDENTDATSLIEAMAASVNSFAEVFAGPNGFIRNKGMGKKFDTTKSWVRLAHSGHGKLGGGSRVKQISLSDEWDVMTDNASIGDQYGQTYTYELENGKSSGVATFEPLLSKENPLIVPLSYEEKRFGVPNEKYMLEKPYGLSFYPSPQVTYSRVEVRSLDKIYDRNNTITDQYSKNRTGKTVTEFYTTRDFPTIVRQTVMDKKPHTPDLVMQLLKLNVREHATVSQGYVIELNDMNGKMKSQMVFAENKEQPLSGVIYRYGSATETIDYSALDGSITDPFENVTVQQTKLDNNVLTIEPDGTVEENLIGVEFDIITDFRESRTENISAGADGNMYGFLAGFLPIPAGPIILPTFSKQSTRFRSAVTTKVINRYGILRETIAFDNGARVSTENLAWDSETGSVLLTRTKNEFGDYYYSMNFPAHWSYERMGQAYQNIMFATGFITEVGTTDYYTGTGVANLVKGDEVILTSINGAGSVSMQKAWVLDVNTSSQAFFINEAGAAVTLPGGTSTYAKVIRSGRRNQHDTPVGTLVSKENPIITSGSNLVVNNTSFTNAAIINASATEFAEDWGLQCGGIISTPSTCACTINQAGQDFIYLINFLLQNGWISASSVSLGSGHPGIDLSQFNEYTSSSLPSVLPSYTSPYLFVSYIDGTDDQIVFSFGNGLSGWETPCSITVTAPEFPSFPHGTVLTYGGGHFANPEVIVDASCSGENFSITWYRGYLETIPFYATATSCFDFFDCTGSLGGTEYCGLNPGSVVNPFRENIQGVWRPLRGWARLGARHQMNFDLTANANQSTDVRTQGEYQQFQYFWQYQGTPSAGDKYWQKDETDWTWVTTITPFRGYDQDGMERENMDALYRFSAAINGYANTLPIAVAANATYRQIAFDGFEDYDYYAPEECRKRHFAFEDATRSNLESHTGRYSLQLKALEEAALSRGLVTSGYTIDAKEAPYKVRDCECQGTFGPETYNVATFAKGLGTIAQDKQYLISFWVKRAYSGPLVSSYDDVSLTLATDAGATPITLSTPRVSAIIDGWQKVEYTFTITGDASGTPDDISVKFKNAGSTNLYVDDIRIQPFSSAMKTYVYDPLNLRLMAELDDNNFATFYEYDEEGKLVRIKKETERGIMTIQESRNGIIKQDLNP